MSNSENDIRKEIEILSINIESLQSNEMEKRAELVDSLIKIIDDPSYDSIKDGYVDAMDFKILGNFEDEIRVMAILLLGKVASKTGDEIIKRFLRKKLKDNSYQIHVRPDTLWKVLPSTMKLIVEGTPRYPLREAAVRALYGIIGYSILVHCENDIFKELKRIHIW